RPLFRKVPRPRPNSQAAHRRNCCHASGIVFGKVASEETPQHDPALAGILNGRGSGPAHPHGPPAGPLRPAQCHPHLADVSSGVTGGRSRPLATRLPRPFWRKANPFRELFAFMLSFVATINFIYS